MLEHLWAAWRGEYVGGATASSEGGGCVFCAILASGEPDDATFVVWRGEHTAVLLNAFPYTSGHVLVLPLRHVGDLDELGEVEADELFRTARHAARAIKAAYDPGGLNLGANLGQAAGAGIPGHLHLHVLPRWEGDTNFMTSVAGTRVLPEALATTWTKLKEQW